MFELVKTERKYLANLKLCLSVFHDPMCVCIDPKLQAQGWFNFGRRNSIAEGGENGPMGVWDAADLRNLFGQIPGLVGFTELMLAALTAALPVGVESDTDLSECGSKLLTKTCSEMAKVFVEPGMIHHARMLYKEYAKNHERAKSTLEVIRKNGEASGTL